MMLEQHPPPKISEKMDCGGGMGKKEGEEKGKWREEEQRIRQVLLSLVGEEIERTKRRKGRREEERTDCCNHALHYTARGCFCPPDSHIWLYVRLNEIMADYCRLPRTRQPEANPQPQGGKGRGTALRDRVEKDVFGIPGFPPPSYGIIYTIMWKGGVCHGQRLRL